MALPRFKPDYVWSEDDWASLPIKAGDLAAKLRAAGFKVLGLTNKRPTLQEKINDNELQLLVTKLLRGDASSSPSPISISKPVPVKEHSPGKKKSK